MSYLDQKSEWLKKQKKATPEELKMLAEAWEAGYWTASDNWCTKKR